MTALTLKFAGSIVAKESYTTVKNRLHDSRNFFEVTVNGGKKLFAKSEVQGVAFDKEKVNGAKKKK